MELRMEALATQMESWDQEIRQELAIYKVVVSAQVMTIDEASRVEVPKPRGFSGKRDAKELDNFLWHIERYFEAIALTNEVTKVRIVTLYLIMVASEVRWYGERHLHHRDIGRPQKGDQKPILPRRRGLLN